MTTEPPGANVYVKPYASPEEEWRHLGSSPLESVRLPVSIVRWKLVKPGYDTQFAASATWDLNIGAQHLSKESLVDPNDFFRALDETGTVPPGMVRVQGTETPSGAMGDFYLDRCEVTNRKYAEFIKSGGYHAGRFWTHPFVKDGSPIGREEAMAHFVDQTGRPGPSTWRAGAYPEGQPDHPVSGVSWYEAAAYCTFTGKHLPAAAHWGLASGDSTSLLRWPQLGGYALMAPFANFEGEEPRAVCSGADITPFGAHDMGGNVREWCFNETPTGRVLRGGAWSDATYMFRALSHLPPMDRSPQNGFRCILYAEPEPSLDAARATIEPHPGRDFTAEKPVSDEVFAAFRERFAYDPAPLNARLESQTTSEYWLHETVSYDAVYDGDRIIAHLFLPQTASPPYQTVIYFPGSASLFESSSTEIQEYYEFPIFLSFIVTSGRAALYPVYEGTFERHDLSLAAIHAGRPTHRYTEYLTRIVKDFKRSVDYLQSRDDIDGDKLAYYGMSWGGSLGGIIPAVEDRLQASIILSGGIAQRALRPEADPVNYLPRIRVPTLMMNGRYDTLLSLDDSIRPMFELLGAPQEDKKLHLFDTDHVPPRDEVIAATLAWLDRYLGPVRRGAEVERAPSRAASP